MDVVLLALVIIAGIGAFALLGAGWWRLARRHHAAWSRTALLRARFGCEYDRAVAIEGRQEGEAALLARMERFGDLAFPRLPASSSEEYARAWRQLHPRSTSLTEGLIADSERLVVTVMEARGICAVDGTTRADALSVSDPALAAQYRRAHQVFCLVERQRASADQVHGVIAWYREVLEHLLDRPTGDLVEASEPVAPGPRPSMSADVELANR